MLDLRFSNVMNAKIWQYLKLQRIKGTAELASLAHKSIIYVPFSKNVCFLLTHNIVVFVLSIVMVHKIESLFNNKMLLWCCIYIY